MQVAAAWPTDQPLFMLHSGRLHRRWSRWSILARPVRTSRDQIHHASERGRTIKSRRRTFDYLDTRQIHGRHLEWSQGAGLSAIEGHTVGENLRVSAP